MLRRLTLAICILAVPAYAADQQPTPAINPDAQFSITLTAQQWREVIASLGDSAAISARDAHMITAQIVHQVEAKAQPAKAAK